MATKINVNMSGLNALVTGLGNKKGNMHKVPILIKKHGDKLTAQTHSNMRNTYTKRDKKGRPYSTGATRHSFDTFITDGGLTAIVEPHTKYFRYVEHGTRKMSAEPTLRPAFQAVAPGFIRDIKFLIEKG